ncbi:MAG: DUF3450 domain-containing protein [Desulfobacteraceae bacterium]|nr:DUF3450 domain-containing protein [Desulfobacteraceae bacterium]
MNHKTIIMINLCCLLLAPCFAWCQTNITAKVTQNVEQSIQIHQESQKQENQWEQERSSLTLKYEQLQQEYKTLAVENRELLAMERQKKILNQKLIEEKQTSLRIQKELLPFIETVVERLSTLQSEGLPFLNKERNDRMKLLKKIINDPGVSVAQKYRKVMETLFIETEYGSTMEVYQDKVLIGTQEIQGNIFRLGRVSLFFLSLDQKFCATFNPAKASWQPLSNDYLPAISSAVEIAKKRKPVELLSLPLGSLSPKGDNQ